MFKVTRGPLGSFHADHHSVCAVLCFYIIFICLFAGDGSQLWHVGSSWHYVGPFIQHIDSLKLWPVGSVVVVPGA